MGQFVRLIDHSIVDFFVQQAEDPRYSRNQFLKNPPYLLGDRKLNGLFGNIPEESTDSLVVAEAFCNRKDIILETAQCRGGKLRCEASALTLAESQIGLAILEYVMESFP